MNKEQKTEFKNITLAWGKPTQKGGFVSGELKASDMDTLLRAEPGSKLSVRKVKSKNRETGEEFESCVFELIPAEEVRKFKAEMELKKANFNTKIAPASGSSDLDI